MNAGTQRLCAWCGIGFVILCGVGLGLVAGFFPPPSPMSSPEAVAQVFSEHRLSIRTGLLITLIGSPLMFPWVVVISIQMRRAEGAVAPLALTQLVSGAAGVLIFVLPVMILQAAAFQGDGQDPRITSAINDIGWLMLVGTFSMAIVQNLAIALAVFKDRRAQPVFPRWVGYFNVWTALLFVPGGLVVYFKNGPFAWDGIFAWWVPLSVFGLWFIVMFAALRRAIAQDEGEHAGGGAGISGVVPTALSSRT